MLKFSGVNNLFMPHISPNSDVDSNVLVAMVTHDKLVNLCTSALLPLKINVNDQPSYCSCISHTSNCSHIFYHTHCTRLLSVTIATCSFHGYQIYHFQMKTTELNAGFQIVFAF